MSSNRTSEYATLIASTSISNNRPIEETKSLPILPWHMRVKQYVWKLYRKATRSWWAWEIFAAGVSLSATISIIIVLLRVDKQQQQVQSIGGAQLTINTVIAGLGTILRTSLLLAVAGGLNQGAWNWFTPSVGQGGPKGRPLEDLETFSDASANSWNCIKLLWRTRFRYLVTIGAMVMILSLLFDPFLQQMLGTEQQSKDILLTGSNLTSNYILPRCTQWNSSSGFMSDYDHGYGLGKPFWTSRLTNALVEDDTPLPNANCPFERCSWPVTPSLATCYECKSANVNISQSFNATCSNITTYSLVDRPQYNTTISVCNDNIRSSSWQMITEWTTFDEPVVFFNSTESTVTTDTTIVRLYSFGVPQLPWNWGRPGNSIAYECSISFCVKGYTGYFSDGLSQMSLVKDIGIEADFLLEDSDADTIKFVNIPPTLNVDAMTTIKVEIDFMIVLASSIEMVLNANTNTKAFLNETTDLLQSTGETTNMTAPTEFTASPMQGVIVIPVSPAETEVSGVAAYILAAGSGSLENITAMVGKLSDSMTNHFRTASQEDPDPRYAPTVAVSVPVVVVRWPWLSYILVLQFTGLLFLFLTILNTRRRRVRAWKGQRTALLLAKLDPKLQHRAIGGLSHRTGLDDRIGKNIVRLEFDGDDGIVFRRVED